MASAAATRLLEDLHAQGQSYEDGDPDARLKILELCKSLTAELERPSETYLRLFWGQTTHALALRVAVDLRVFATLAEDNEAPKTSVQLAAPKSADPVLVVRIMRHLAAMHTVLEVDTDTYALTRFSRELAHEPMHSAFGFITDDFTPAFWLAPEFLAERGWQNPTNSRDTIAGKFWQAPNTTMFEHLASNPGIGQRFGAMMVVEAADKPMWADERAYPVRERLSNASSEEVLLVDIAGGVGHDISGFKTRHPELKGRLVLQELPYLVDQVKDKLDGIEVMVHDFNKPQPIEGAHAYFFHQIMHDYSDAECLHILQQIKPSMKAGHSKILINELVLPNQGAHWFTTALDLGLMTCLASRERTEKEFRDLFDSAGLVVAGIFKHPQGFECIIELRLP